MRATLNRERVALAKKEYLNLKETAALLRVSPSTLSRAIRSGEPIPFRRIGSRYIFSVDALKIWTSKTKDYTL